MLQVALWEPEIPPNTGNIARLCAATATRLHLIGRLGFQLDDRHLKRAGLDYWPSVDLQRHATFEQFTDSLGTPVPQIWLVDNPAPKNYTQAPIRDGDVLFFGAESRGVPDWLKARCADTHIGIPMPGEAVRSLNLATAVGIVLYDALRRLHNW